MSHEIRDKIFIGKKPLMTYVTAVIIQLATLPKIIIKARGMSIGTAVDVVQIVLRKTSPAFMVENIEINSESLVSTDGRNRDVSTIEITLKRATGWVRVVSGVQSLISIYLLALWALTQFGRPFE